MLVERILQHNLLARSSDNELNIEVLQARGANLSEHQKAIIRDINFESIRRTRQKFQEQGKYPATDRIRRHRKFKGMQVQQMITQTKPEKVEKLIQEPMFDLPPERRYL